jgi:type VI secretion system protein ImpB
LSIHNKLEKVRKPRVHITYEVETNGASSKKELPFVIGITGDFTGHNIVCKIYLATVRIYS